MGNSIMKTYLSRTRRHPCQTPTLLWALIGHFSNLSNKSFRTRVRHFLDTCSIIVQSSHLRNLSTFSYVSKIIL